MDEVVNNKDMTNNKIELFILKYLNMPELDPNDNDLIISKLKEHFYNIYESERLELNELIDREKLFMYIKYFAYIYNMTTYRDLINFQLPN